MGTQSQEPTKVGRPAAETMVVCWSPTSRRFLGKAGVGCLLEELASMNLLKTFLTEEDGPTAVEYAVMLSLIVVVCIVAVRAIGTSASSTFQRVSTEIQNAGGS